MLLLSCSVSLLVLFFECCILSFLCTSMTVANLARLCFVPNPWLAPCSYRLMPFVYPFLSINQQSALALVDHNTSTLLNPFCWLGSSLMAIYWIVFKVQGPSVTSSPTILLSPPCSICIISIRRSWTGSLQQ